MIKSIVTATTALIMSATVSAAATFSVVTVDSEFNTLHEPQKVVLDKFTCDVGFGLVIAQMKAQMYPHLDYVDMGIIDGVKFWMVMPNNGENNVMIGCVEANV